MKKSIRNWLGVMVNQKIGIVVIVLFFSILLPSQGSAEDFNWIINSVSKVGSLPNGDGHYWDFQKTSGGKWEVVGAGGNSASVTSAGKNKVEIYGFPSDWGADGVFKFSRSSRKCALVSEHGTHEVRWKY